MKLGLVLMLASCSRAAAVRAGREQSLEAGFAGKAEVAPMKPEEGEAKKEDASKKEVDVGTNVINILKPFTGEGWVNFEVDDEAKGVVKQISQLATGLSAFLTLADPGPVGKAAGLGLTIIAGILPGVFNVEEPLPNNLKKEFGKLHEDLDGIKGQLSRALGYLRKIDENVEKLFFEKEEGFRNTIGEALADLITVLGSPNGQTAAAGLLHKAAQGHLKDFNDYKHGFVSHMRYILKWRSKAAAVLYAQQNLATQIQAVSYLYTWRMLSPKDRSPVLAAKYLRDLQNPFREYREICNQYNLWPWLRVGAEELFPYADISQDARIEMSDAAEKLDPDSGTTADSRTTALRELLSSWTTKETGALLAEPLRKVLAKTKGGLIKSTFVSKWHERGTDVSDNLGFCLGYTSGAGGPWANLSIGHLRNLGTRAVQASPCRGEAAQLWHFDGPLLRSHATNTDCLHYNPSDEKLYAKKCEDRYSNQHFFFEDGILKTKFDLGLCLELRKNERVGESHQVAMTRSCQATPSTQWYFFAAEGAQFRSRHKEKNMCLTYVMEMGIPWHIRYTASVAECSGDQVQFHMLGDQVQFRPGTSGGWMPPAQCLMSWDALSHRTPIDFYPCARYKPYWECHSALPGGCVHADIVYDEASEELRVQNIEFPSSTPEVLRASLSGQCLDWAWGWWGTKVVQDTCRHLDNQRWVLTRDDCTLAVDALERMGLPAAQEAIQELGDIARQQHLYDDRAGRCIKRARKLLKVLAPPTDWQCHTLEDWQDETWCDTAGVQPDGMEYAFARPAQNTSCGGCGCCKREVSALGLGPTGVPDKWHWACHHLEAGQPCPTTPQNGLEFKSSAEGGVVGQCGQCACCRRPVGASSASLTQQEEIVRPMRANDVWPSNAVAAADQAALSPVAAAAEVSGHMHVVSATDAVLVSSMQLQSNETDPLITCNCRLFAEKIDVPVWNYCGARYWYGACYCDSSGLCQKRTERFKTIEMTTLEEEFQCKFNLESYMYECQK